MCIREHTERKAIPYIQLRDSPFAGRKARKAFDHPTIKDLNRYPERSRCWLMY